MRPRYWIILLLLAIPLRGYSQSASSAFALTDKSANSTITNGSGNISVGYARIVANSGSTTPSGVAIFGYKPAGVLVTEAGVPASPLIKNGRIYAEVGPNGSTGTGADIGMAIANPNSSAAVISFSFTKADGTDAGSGSYTLGAGQQYASFLDQTPWNVPLNFQGTFTFTSSVAISVVALQLNNNTRGEALITTLPVINTDIAPGTTPAVLSHFVDGAGFTTSVLLVNPTDTTMTGAIQFRGQDGSISTLTANGTTGTSFSYSIPRRSSFKLQTAGAGGLQVGSITVTPAAGSNTPVSLGVFAYANGATTITTAGVPSSLGTGFRTYVEATTGLGAVGTYSTGVAVANASSAAGTLSFDLFSADGNATTYSTTKPIAGYGQFSGFLSDLFPALPLPFQGVLRVRTSTASISAVALRIHYNERTEFLMTTTPPTEENGTASTAEYDFPHILNGGGFTTQFILFSGVKGQATSGNLQFFKSDSTALGLTVNSTISAAPVTLTSISPTTAAVGSSVTVTGTGFTANTQVVFTGSSGPVPVTPTAQTSTSLTATVPATAITGPVIVQNGPASSSALILTVTAAGGAPLTTSVSVGASASLTGVDIYVPGGTALNPSLLSLQPVGFSGGFSEQSTALEISRGASKVLIVDGSGIVSGATITISGTGATMSGVQFANGFVLGTITVDGNAATGPRNIVITNPNGDTAILTGGILIQ